MPENKTIVIITYSYLTFCHPNNYHDNVHIVTCSRLSISRNYQENVSEFLENMEDIIFRWTRNRIKLIVQLLEKISNFESICPIAIKIWVNFLIWCSNIFITLHKCLLCQTVYDATSNPIEAGDFDNQIYCNNALPILRKYVFNIF